MHARSVSAAGAILLMSTYHGMADLVPIYEEDFSSDPGWVTDDPAKLRWDSASGTFSGRQVNTEGTYAYKHIPWLDSTKAWRLEWDARVNSCTWSTGLVFGLYDSRLNAMYEGTSVHVGISDPGRFTSLYSIPGGVTWVTSPAWSAGVWYHNTIEYDPSTYLLTLDVKNRDSGSPFITLSYARPGPLLADMNYLGPSLVHMKGGTSGVNPWATVDYNLDNVRLSAVPAPGAVVLGWIGLALVGRVRRRW